jgi:tripartite-type tricarboxylate transporter receptor subunit TctC
LAGPPHLPHPIVQRLNQEVRKFLRSQEMRQHFAREALLSKDFDLDQLKQFIIDEGHRWRAAVQAVNFQKQ